MKWEYKLLSSPGWDVDLLNRLGDDGWELIGFTRDNGAVLKRPPMPPEPTPEELRLAAENAQRIPVALVPQSKKRR